MSPDRPWPPLSKKLGIKDGSRRREIGLAHRLVDDKVCAIDEVWSALRLVLRLTDR